MAQSIVKEVRTSHSVIAINDGNGNFTVKELPARVQFSCICGISCTDVNGDGNLDLIMGGNNYEFKPQYSQLDASYGDVLLTDGKMNFDWQDHNQSGFFVKGEVKHIELFRDKNGKQYLIGAINNEKPKVFTAND